MNEAWHKNINIKVAPQSGKDTLEHRTQMLEMLAFSYNQQ